MSSITAVSYVVESAAESRRREQQAAWEYYAAQRAELSALRAEAKAYSEVLGGRITAIPACPKASPRSAPEKIAEAAERARRIVVEYTKRLQESVAAIPQHDILQEISGATTGEEPTPVAAAPAREFTIKRAAADDRRLEAARRAGEVRRKLVDRATELLARLPPRAPADTRAACVEAVREIADVPSASEARARLVLADLSVRVRQAVDDEQAIQQAEIALEALSTRLELLAGAEAATLRREIARLAETRPRAVPRGLADRVSERVEEENRAQRRKTVANAMRLSLDDLGYTVSEGFETVLVEQGSAYAGAPGRPGYGLKVLLDRKEAVLRTQVVRSQQAMTDDKADLEAERGFCSDHPNLLSRLRRHGVAVGEPTLRAPGQGPLLPVAEALLPVAASTHRPNVREMRR
ncbi:hypothetical protein [Amycolatopsis sp. Hca4]|uniref:hypothetical protein n=1 Tax=Amycolatopsis sp. Hca4 TaxID=2742131 RepID=UPI00159282E8|nr:hypothetical protein [Amycolatopsis sp. Hca4]QKV74889.1 hypothetical protein HUT10_14750 [Amycolatopsis sp. Hca4]